MSDDLARMVSDCLKGIGRIEAGLAAHIADKSQHGGAPPTARASQSSFDPEITGEHLAIVEAEKTKRWQIAAGVVAAAIVAAGGMLAGRATAPPAPSVPYAVPASGVAK